MKKLLCTAALALAATTASASQVGWNIPGVGASNGFATEFAFLYSSQSTVTDTDGDGVLSDGDVISSNGGFGPLGFDALVGSPLTGTGQAAIDFNYVSGFTPGSSVGTNYGFGAGEFLFSFSFNNFMGVWDSGKGDFEYGPGVIQFGYYDIDSGSFNNLFKIDIAFGGNRNVFGQAKQVFVGEIDETSLENGAGSAFTIKEGWTTQSLADWLVGDLRVLFDSNQTVTSGLPGFPAGGAGVTFAAPGDTTIIAANHTGRFSLNVPEPSTIAIFGLSLLGVAAAGRKRKLK